MARDRSITDELGIRRTAAAAAELYGWVLMLAADLPAAEAEARRGFDSLLVMGDRSSASTLAAVLAQILYAPRSLRRGARADRARSRRVVARRSPHADPVARPAGEALARRGEAVEAERLAREGVELAESTDFLNVRGTALLDLAEVLLVAGRNSEAAEAVAAATALFEQKGNVVGAGALTRAPRARGAPASAARRAGECIAVAADADLEAVRVVVRADDGEVLEDQRRSVIAKVPVLGLRPRPSCEPPSGARS